MGGGWSSVGGAPLWKAMHAIPLIGAMLAQIVDRQHLKGGRE